MAKYSDADSVGRSSISPFIAGEGASRRHARRHRVSQQYADEVRTFCRQNEIKMAIKNEGHHWQFRVAKHIVDWWPSSAKMVTDAKWNKGKHVHDARQLIRELQWIMKKEQST